MLKKLEQTDWEPLYQFECDNREWFEKWVPPRPKQYYVKAEFEKVIAKLLQEMMIGEIQLYLLIENGEIIGRFNITGIDGAYGEIGYRMGQNAAGKGLATKGLNELMAEAKNPLNLKKLVAYAANDNIASQKVLLNNGFKKTDAPSISETLNGKPIELITYEITL